MSKRVEKRQAPYIKQPRRHLMTCRLMKTTKRRLMQLMQPFNPHSNTLIHYQCASSKELLTLSGLQECYSKQNVIISTTTDNNGDASNKIADGMNSVRLQPGWDLVEAKFTVALEEFTFCRHNNDERLPRFLIEWNMALSLIALGRIEEAAKVALSSIKQRQEIDLVQLSDDPMDNTNNLLTIRKDQTNIDILNRSEKLAKVIFSQRAYDRMETMSRTTEVSSLSSFNGSLESNSKDDPLLKDVLQQAVDLDLLGRSSADKILRRFRNNNFDKSSDANKKITIDAWNIAIKDTRDLKIATHDLRVNIATLIMDHVVKAY